MQNIFAIFSFRNGLSTLLAQLKSSKLKSLKKVIKMKNNTLFNIWGLFWDIFKFVTFFSRLVLIQPTQFFSDNNNFLDYSLWWSIFFLNFQNGYGHQTGQGGDILQEVSSNKFEWHIIEVVLWSHVTRNTYLQLQ